MNRFLPAATILLVLTSCTVTSTTTASVTTTTAAATTTSPPTTVETGTPACLAGDQPFTEDGALAAGLLDGPDGDAARVTELRWFDHGTCGRFVVELATGGGAPATEPGGVRAELLRDLGIVRIGLAPLITSTAVADRLIDSPLIGRAYVVRAADGSLFVDLHLAAAVVARASVTRSPAAIVVDLQPGGVDLAAGPVTSDLVVVTEPTGDRAEYPLSVRGYGRPFEATVILRVRKANRTELEEVGTTADYVETWGEFAFAVPSGPTGRVGLFVGEESARDGSEQGVTISLVMN